MPRAPKKASSGTLGEDYATRAGRERGMLRTVLSDGLVEFVGDPHAAMFYAPCKFRDEVALPYGVKLLGWPDGIEFTNLSALKNPTAKVRALLDAWAEGAMRWEWLTQDELIAAIFDVRSACPGPHFPNPMPRAQRSDTGKRRPRAANAERDKYPPRFARDGPKSMRHISRDMEERMWWPITTWAARIGMGVRDAEVAEDAGDVVEQWCQALPPRQELHCELPEDPIEEF